MFTNSGYGENFQNLLDSFEKEIIKSPGYIPIEDLIEMEKKMYNLNKNRLKIAVMHHNLSSVPSDGLESFDAISNAGIIKEFLIKHGFDLVLHGHSHDVHFSYERFLLQETMRGMFILGGDALGVKKNAPFLEIKIYDTNKAHSNKIPACRFAVNTVNYQYTGYRVEPQPLFKEILDNKLNITVRGIIAKMGDFDTSSLSFRERTNLLRDVRGILSPLNKLEDELSYWGEKSDDWIRNFHYHLDRYHRIYAVDYYDRSSLNVSKFNKYIRRQYDKRYKDLSTNNDHTFSFTRSVSKAISQTGWQPDPTRWNNFEKREVEKNNLKELEIVRILIRPEAKQNDREMLENLDFDHRNFAIPLFILEEKNISKDESDFIIGYDDKGNIISCWAFIDGEGKVCEVNPRDGLKFDKIFEKLLAHHSLKTVHEFFENGTMIKSSKHRKIFADNYDKTRRPSNKILEVLRGHLHPNQKKIGLDIGCGTGNYTIPFIKEFHEVTGLDISKEMLDKAKEKTTSKKVKWMEKDVMDAGLKPKYYDAVWLISTLHYFKGERQKSLFQEIYRILKPGGVMVADNAFKEQLDSLWLTKFFPSLKDRYVDSCLSIEMYRRWLKEIGFQNIKIEFIEYDSTDNDAGLRIGQKKPELYLDEKTRNGIPAFYEMNQNELKSGLEELENAINDGSIKQIIENYKNPPSIDGYEGFIIAIR